MTTMGGAGPLVIGYGNELRGDDGAGPAVVRLLDDGGRLRGVRFLAVRQLTPDLAADIAAASRVVLVDASVDVPPGAVEVAQRPCSAAAATAAPFSHHLDPAALVDLAGELFGTCPQVAVVRIGVHDLDQPGLSPRCEAAVARAADAVAALLAATD